MSSELVDRWVQPLGHLELLEGLWRSAREGHLPHALALRGHEGIGKYLAARWLALGLLCETGPGAPCLGCGPCKRGVSGNHPDLFSLDARADGLETLSVFHVAHRELRPTEAYQGPAVEDFLLLRAHEGGWRVVLVRDAELMNEAAQNAFLKTLEEPGARVLIVLTCSQPGALMGTVRSRLVNVELACLSVEETVGVLREHGLADVDKLARWSRGSPGLALTHGERGVPRMRDILIQVLCGEKMVQQACAELWELPGEFPGKQPAARLRMRVRTLVDLGLALFLDQERWLAGTHQERLGHGDVLGELPLASDGAREERLECWLQARRDVALNLTPEAIVERALRAAAPAVRPQARNTKA